MVSRDFPPLVSLVNLIVFGGQPPFCFSLLLTTPRNQFKTIENLSFSQHMQSSQNQPWIRGPIEEKKKPAT
jgi:hypothetical protein